jgi:hypothetical protein
MKNAIFLLTLLAMAGASVSAQRVQQMSAATVAEQARSIVVARVADSQVRLDGNIYTYVTFDNLQTVKGAVDRRFTIRMLGGRFGDTVLDGDPPNPTFTRGQEVVLFLGDTSRAGYPALYFDHIYVVSTTRTGERTVSKMERESLGTAAAPRPVPLAAFLQSLRKP